MATYKICRGCGKCVEVKKTVRHEFGNEIIEYVCPECGYVDKTTINHVHYGNDGIRKGV